MTPDSYERALVRLIEKLEARTVRAHGSLETEDVAALKPFGRGFVAANEMALEDARMLLTIARARAVEQVDADEAA